jgi:hypothetical protein
LDPGLVSKNKVFLREKKKKKFLWAGEKNEQFLLQTIIEPRRGRRRFCEEFTQFIFGQIWDFPFFSLFL